MSKNSNRGYTTSPTKCPVLLKYESDAKAGEYIDLEEEYRKHRDILSAFSATNLKPLCGCPHLPFTNRIDSKHVTYYLSKVIISYNGVTFTADKLAGNHEIFTSMILKEIFPKELAKLMSEYFGIYHWLVYGVVKGW